MSAWLLLPISWRIGLQEWKNFKNRPTFARVINECTVAQFLDTVSKCSVFYLQSSSRLLAKPIAPLYILFHFFQHLFKNVAALIFAVIDNRSRWADRARLEWYRSHLLPLRQRTWTVKSRRSSLTQRWRNRMAPSYMTTGANCKHLSARSETSYHFCVNPSNIYKTCGLVWQTSINLL